MASDAATHYRATIGALTEAIRISDFKANVAIVFVGIMMGPVIVYRDKFPFTISPTLLFAPFLLIFFCLLVCLYPRYARRGKVHFVIGRNAHPDLFQLPDDEMDELQRQQTLCALFSRILYWKTLMLLISFYTCLAYVAAVTLALIYHIR